jgi:hypothetical protein
VRSPVADGAVAQWQRSKAVWSRTRVAVAPTGQDRRLLGPHDRLRALRIKEPLDTGSKLEEGPPLRRRSAAIAEEARTSWSHVRWLTSKCMRPWLTPSGPTSRLVVRAPPATANEPECRFCS